MRYVYYFVFSLFASANIAIGQTNPAPQSLPYSQDFDALAHSSTTYPAGWQGWQLSGNPGSTFKTTAPASWSPSGV